jgi:hypothetical protein
VRANGEPPGELHDHDARYGPELDRLAAASSIEVIRTPVQAPRANAACGPFPSSVRRDRADRVLTLGQRHRRHVLTAYVGHVNRARPNRGIGQRTPIPPEGTIASLWPHVNESVIAAPVLGGLHHEYRWAA